MDAANDDPCPPPFRTPHVQIVGFVREDQRVTFTDAAWRLAAAPATEAILFPGDPREA
jgi:hypothetical protein